MLLALFILLFAAPLSAQSQSREAYVVQSADKTTLTFYYDAQRATRAGTKWDISDSKMDKKGERYRAWTGTDGENDSTITQAVFDVSFQDFRLKTMIKWFYNLSALSQIEGMEYLNTSEVKNMSAMFKGCSSLMEIELQHFNTERVTDMAEMFRKCSSLKSLDLRNFQTQNVTSMYGMFYDCWGLSSLELNNFSTERVTDMADMF